MTPPTSSSTARYLDGRIQTRDDEKPGRKPDLSEEAGKAMRAVLEEVGGVKLFHFNGLNPWTNGFNQPLWAALEQLARELEAETARRAGDEEDFPLEASRRARVERGRRGDGRCVRFTQRKPRGRASARYSRNESKMRKHSERESREARVRRIVQGSKRGG